MGIRKTSSIHFGDTWGTVISQAEHSSSRERHRRGDLTMLITRMDSEEASLNRLASSNLCVAFYLTVS
jgi:hypothetical protein